MKFTISLLAGVIFTGCSAHEATSAHNPDLPMRSCKGFIAEALHQVVAIGMPPSEAECVTRSNASQQSRSLQVENLQADNEERLARLEWQIATIKENWDN